MSLYTIENECLRVSANGEGAQLWSITAKDGTQYLWQGDPAYWSDRALTLFPYVARLWQGKYTLDGRTYSMPIHGFAPQSCFVLEKKTDTSMTLALYDSDDTYEMYPYRFAFRVTYALDGHALSCTYEVENRDGRTMHFGLGGHPGFCVPLEPGRQFEDYRLRFAQTCKPVRVGFSKECFVTGEDTPFVLEMEHTLPLRHDLFDDDAIVLRGMVREVTLEAPGGKRSVTVSFPDMPYLGIWHWPKTGAPYVCIEPWSSLPSRHGKVTALEEKEDLIWLEPGKIYRNCWKILIGE